MSTDHTLESMLPLMKKMVAQLTRIADSLEAIELDRMGEVSPTIGKEIAKFKQVRKERVNATAAKARRSQA